MSSATQERAMYDARPPHGAPAPRRPAARAAGALLLSLPVALALPQAARGQDVVDSYFRAVAAHFDVPAEEVLILSEWRIPPEHVPVVLHLAHHAGISPDALVAQRGSRSWHELAARYGLNAGAFHVPLPESVSEGPLARAREAFQATPRGQWSGITLSDPEVVALVNVRFLSEFLDVAPARVVEAAAGTESFVNVYARLLRRS